MSRVDDPPPYNQELCGCGTMTGVLWRMAVLQVYAQRAPVSDWTSDRVVFMAAMLVMSGQAVCCPT